MDPRFYESLLKKAPFPYCVNKIAYDQQGTPVDWVIVEGNPGFLNLTGLVIEALNRTSFSELAGLPAKERARWAAFYHRLAAEGRNTIRTVKLPPPQGAAQIQISSPMAEYFVLFIQGLPAWEPAALPVPAQGPLLRELYTGRESHPAPPETIYQEERFALALEGTGAGLWDWDMKSDRVYYSPQWSRMLGYEPEEITPDFSAWQNLWHPDDAEAITKAVDDYLKGRSAEYKIEHRLKAKDGSWRWILTKGRIQHDRDGVPVRWLGTNINIDEMKQAEAAMGKFDKLFNRNPAMMTVSTLPKQNFTEINDAFLRKTGYSRREVLGKTAEELKIFPNREDCREITRLLAREQHLVDKEYRLQTKEGKILIVLLSAEIIAINGIRNLLTVMIDITELREAQDSLAEVNEHLEQQTAYAKEMALQAQMASSAKSEFLANMSHEIRTPLNAVVGFTDLLLSSPLSDLQRKYLKNVHTAAESLLLLINDILDFSKIEAGKLELDPVPVSLPLLLEDVVDTIAFKAHQKGLELILDIGRQVPERVEVDKMRLSQIIINLLSNAVKFTESGEVELAVSPGPEKSTGRVNFSVRDTGIGMTNEEQKRIFRSFTQADHTTTRKYGGTGLGLSIAKNLVEKMGGKLLLKSSPGKGSTFSFSLTMETLTDPDAAPIPALPIETALIADDHPHIRALLKNMLSELGIRAATAANGIEALEYLKGQKPDVVLLDQEMPFMDGLTVAEKIRTDRGITEDQIALLLLHTTLLPPERLTAPGLRKPVRKSELIKALQSLKERAPEERSSREAPSAAGSPPLPQRPGITILIAEDNEPNRVLLRSMLTGILPGVTLIEAQNGNEALELFIRHRPELIFMDIQMPQTDGYDATRLIRQEESEQGGHAEIIALTAGAMEGDRAKCLEAGMDDYLSKPVRRRELETMLQNIIPEPPAAGTGTPTGPAGTPGQQYQERIRAYLTAEGHDRETIEELLETLRRRLPDLREESGRALAARDWPLLEQAAHAAKGVLGTVGLTAPAETAADIEAALRDGQVQQAAELTENLGKQLKEIHSRIEEGGSG